MLDASTPDELLFAVQKLSSQIEVLRLAMAQGSTSRDAASAIGGQDKNFPGSNANCAAFEQPREQCDRLIRAAKPSLPDPRMIRRIIRQRQMRDRFFDRDLFGDPVWDMLLDLAAATSEGCRVSVTSVCIASRVPHSTALRWIGIMTAQGLLRRVEDPDDRRRAFIALTEDAVSAMARYFESLGADAKILV